MVLLPSLPTVVPALEQLHEEVLDEQLLSKTVDVDDVAAELLTTLLRTVERRRFVDDRITRPPLATTGELGPPRRICPTYQSDLSLPTALVAV